MVEAVVIYNHHHYHYYYYCFWYIINSLSSLPINIYIYIYYQLHKFLDSNYFLKCVALAWLIWFANTLFAGGIILRLTLLHTCSKFSWCLSTWFLLGGLSLALSCQTSGILMFWISLYSFLDLPNLSACIYSNELCNRLRAFLIACPPTGPSPPVAELVIATADFQRDLNSWKIR